MTANPEPPPEHRTRYRIAYLFIGNWDHEFQLIRDGKVPTHRVFGAIELERLGHQVEHLTSRGPRVLPTSLRWRAAQLVWALRRSGGVDIFLATHEAAALPVLVLKKVQLVRRPIVVMTVAAAKWSHPPGIRNRLVRWLLQSADVLTVFSAAQVAPLSQLMHRCRGRGPRIITIPLGVDTKFFSPQQGARGNWILSVGTNPGKDFATLVQAVPEHLECLIVTDPDNRARCQDQIGDKSISFRHDVPIIELRDLYAAAKVVVLPLHEVTFSSGQTVLLENLAMDTPVIVSDVSSIRDHVTAAVARLVSAGDAAALSRALGQEDWSPLESPREFVLAGHDALSMAIAIERVLTAVVESNGAPAFP